MLQHPLRVIRIYYPCPNPQLTSLSLPSQIPDTIYFQRANLHPAIMSILYALCILSLFALTSSSSPTTPTPPPNLDESDGIFASHLMQLVSSSSPSPSNHYTVPACWKSTIQVLKHWHETSPVAHENNFDFCMTMTDQDRKKLVYLLTNCHLSDNGRPPLTKTCNAVVENEHGTGGIIDPSSNLLLDSSFDYCVEKLTDFQFQIYTNFNIHVDNVCARLSEEARR